MYVFLYIWRLSIWEVWTDYLHFHKLDVVQLQQRYQSPTPSQQWIIMLGYENFTTSPLLMRPMLIPYSSVDTISPPSQSDRGL